MKLAIIVGVLLVLARPADACGEWSMKDNERGTDISFLINSGRVTKNGKNVGAIYLDDESKHGLRVVAKRKVIFDFKGNALRKHGKTVATVDGNTISFGRRKY